MLTVVDLKQMERFKRLNIKKLNEKAKSSSPPHMKSAHNSHYIIIRGIFVMNGAIVS